MFKKRKRISPVMTFIILTFITILLSGILHLLNVQSEYTTISSTGTLVNNIIEVDSLLSTGGLKYIVTHAVKNFMSFTPMSILVIVLIGIGVLEKSGFLKSFFTLLTKNSKKNTVTFILIFISLLLSLFGDIGFVIMLPIGALLFKYGRRNPFGGIIASFAALSFGSGINIFLTANDSSLLKLTLSAAKITDINYKIGTFFSLFIMIVLLIVTSFVFTYITEKRIMTRLPKYEGDEEEIVISNKELRGIIVGLGLGAVYALIIIYMIIPGLPLSGALLDHNASIYIDMLFGAKSLFNQGFIFIVTAFFALIGFGYGFMCKTIKNTKDVTESLAYSLDNIGNIMVLLFFASLFISVFEESNIGSVFTALISGLIGKITFTGFGLIIISIILIAISNLLLPSSVAKWKMISSSLVPLYMNASISPEFAQILYVTSSSITCGLTPLFPFFVIYLAFLEKYNKEDIVTMKDGIRYMIPYAAYMMVIVLIVLAGFYMIGIPTGVGSFPGVSYGA